MQDYKTMISMCAEQEEKFQFEHFSREDALKIGLKLVCPYCGEEPDMEIGPDEEMPVAKETAKLLEVVEGAENVERMDALLSLAVTGGDYDWI